MKPPLVSLPDLQLGHFGAPRNAMGMSNIIAATRLLGMGFAEVSHGNTYLLLYTMEILPGQILTDRMFLETSGGTSGLKIKMDDWG